MIAELLYTSAPQGLKRGASGFTTVQMTEGLPPPLASQLEALSGYRHVDGAGARGPVCHMHVMCEAGGRRWHVLSRISPTVDYTKRTSKFAHHLALSEESVPGGSPAALAGSAALLDHWDGGVKWLAPRAAAAAVAGPRGPCRAWQAAAGDAGWAGLLAQWTLDSDEPVTLVFDPSRDPSADPLALTCEALELLPPERRWKTTFCTYFTSLPAGTQCQWRWVLAGTREGTAALKRGGRVLSLGAANSPPPAGRLADQARTGAAPRSLKRSAADAREAGARAAGGAGAIDAGAPTAAAGDAATGDAAGGSLELRLAAPELPVAPTPVRPSNKRQGTRTPKADTVPERNAAPRQQPPPPPVPRAAKRLSTNIWAAAIGVALLVALAVVLSAVQQSRTRIATARRATEGETPGETPDRSQENTARDPSGRASARPSDSPSPPPTPLAGAEAPIQAAPTQAAPTQAAPTTAGIDPATAAHPKTPGQLSGELSGQLSGQHSPGANSGNAASAASVRPPAGAPGPAPASPETSPASPPIPGPLAMVKQPLQLPELRVSAAGTLQPLFSVPDGVELLELRLLGAAKLLPAGALEIRATEFKNQWTVVYSMASALSEGADRGVELATLLFERGELKFSWEAQAADAYAQTAYLFSYCDLKVATAAETKEFRMRIDDPQALGPLRLSEDVRRNSDQALLGIEPQRLPRGESVAIDIAYQPSDSADAGGLEEFFTIKPGTAVDKELFGDGPRFCLRVTVEVGDRGVAVGRELSASIALPRELNGTAPEGDWEEVKIEAAAVVKGAKQRIEDSELVDPALAQRLRHSLGAFQAAWELAERRCAAVRKSQLALQVRAGSRDRKRVIASTSVDRSPR